MIYNGIEMEQIPSFREGMNYEGYYVTKTGDVYTAHYRKGHAIKKMSPAKTNSGYLQIVLYDHEKYHREYVHRLVATTYLLNPKHLREVNHKDLDKLNNSVENLEWISPSENVLHAKRNCTKKSKTSSNAGYLYKNKTLIGHFDSLQQAKIYCRENFGCSLSTNGIRNVNKLRHLVFIRDVNFSGFDIDEYWEQEVIRDRELHQHEINRIKAEKGKVGVLYQNGYLIGKSRSIREVQSVLGLQFTKKNPYKYTCRDYEYILDEVS